MIGGFPFGLIRYCVERLDISQSDIKKSEMYMIEDCYRVHLYNWRKFDVSGLDLAMFITRRQGIS